MNRVDCLLLTAEFPVSAIGLYMREEGYLGPAFVLICLLSAICFPCYTCCVFVYIATIADGR
jgi:hypothetical protein